MKVTVGDIKEMLQDCEEDIELDFSGLDFYRPKRRGEKLIQVEFNQLVYKDKKTGLVRVDNLESNS